MKAIATNSFHAWILAARPKTLTGAVIPVLTGSALAFADETFNIIPALLCALFACGMQIAANFAMCAVCLRHADCRQFHQRPLRLPERQ